MAKKKAGLTPDKAAENMVANAMNALASGEKLTDADRKTIRQVGETRIDLFMKGVGFDKPSERTDQNGWRHLQLESAKGVAGIKESEGEMYLHVEAVVVALPSDRDLIQALMREALELNCTLPGACSLGIRGTELVACATENMRTLSSSNEYGNLIHMVMSLANTVDDGLKNKYGGTTRTRKRATAA